MMKKKILCIALILASFFVLCVGCNSKKEETPELNNSEKWAMASYAVLVQANKEANVKESSYKLWGGFPKDETHKEAVQDLLLQMWNVSNKESLVEQIQKLENGQGHNSDFLQELKLMGLMDKSDEEMAEILLSYDTESQKYLSYMIDAYKRYGNKAIEAWDLSRANSLCGMGYIADYLSLEESREYSLSISKKIQSNYSSWDEMFDSYLLGYCYWSGEDYQDSTTQAYLRKQYYEKLKAEKNGPYSIAWDTTLE